MAGKSTYLANKLLDHATGAGAFTPPTALHFALMTAAPTDAGGGTEVSGGSYARVPVTANATNFPAASGGSKQNANAITWPTATASWGVVVAVAVYDAATGGNLLWWNTISNKTIDINDTMSIPPANVTFTED